MVQPSSSRARRLSQSYRAWVPPSLTTKRASAIVAVRRAVVAPNRSIIRSHNARLCSSVAASASGGPPQTFQQVNAVPQGRRTCQPVPRAPPSDGTGWFAWMSDLWKRANRRDQIWGSRSR